LNERFHIDRVLGKKIYKKISEIEYRPKLLKGLKEWYAK